MQIIFLAGEGFIYEHTFTFFSIHFHILFFQSFSSFLLTSISFSFYPFLLTIYIVCKMDWNHVGSSRSYTITSDLATFHACCKDEI